MTLYCFLNLSKLFFRYIHFSCFSRLAFHRFPYLIDFITYIPFIGIYHIPAIKAISICPGSIRAFRLMRADSTIVDTMHVFKQWSQGKDDYAYRFDIPAREQQYIIRAEHPDYETTYVNYHVRHIARNTYFDAPWHNMKKRSRMTEDTHQLGEVVVRATKVKLFYRGDTITFNADAFNLPEGSMLDALIRQMPGVELKDDGRILVQGEQVDVLMLNGKDFFKGNNRVMLDNLPAYTVQKVQTYHKSTELSEYLERNYEKKRFVKRRPR